MDDTLHESLLHFQFNALRNLLIFEIILENRLWLSPSLREKSPNTVSFLVRIFPHSRILHISLYSAQMRKNADQKKSPYLGTFYAVHFQ